MKFFIFTQDELIFQHIESTVLLKRRSRYIIQACNKALREKYSAVQMQTAVTAYWTSKS